MHGRWRVIDRPVETGEAVAAVRTGGGVVLAGPAGVGKTTLARRVADGLGPAVRWAACTESSQGVPLGVFAPWLPSIPGRDPIALLAAARSALLAAPEIGHGGKEPAFHTAAVVAVDDAHLLDPLSAMLLQQIAIDDAARIVVTIRTGEAVPAAVTALWKDGRMARVEIGALGRDETVELVESVLGGPIEGLSADVLWNVSAGNPLYLRHAVEGAVAAGRLDEVAGVWQLRGTAAVPEGLADLLESRMDAAAPAAVSVLRHLAFCEPMRLATLAELAGDEAIDAAESAGLVRIVDTDGAPHARIAHPLFGDAVRRRTGAATSRRIRGRIAGALRDQGVDSAADRIRLARLHIDSDQPVDAKLLRAAAKDAVSLADLPLGEALARRAFQAERDVPSAELLARAVMWQGRPTEAEEILSGFAADEMGELDLVRWGIPRLSNLFWGLGDTARAHALLDLLQARVMFPALARVVAAIGATVAIHENRLAEGLSTADDVVSDPQAPEQAVELAAFAAGLALGPGGRGTRFPAIAARCRGGKSTDGLIHAMIGYGEVLSLVYLGRIDEAQRHLREHGGFSSTGQFTGWAIARISAGLVDTHSGRFPAAVAAIEEALAALNAESSLPWRLPARLILVRAYAALGRASEAERVLADADEHVGPQVAVHDPARTLARSWVLAARGADRSAADLACTAATQARRTGQWALEAESLHHAARFGSRGVGGRLGELAGRIDGDLCERFVEHAEAVAAADADRLARVSHRFEETGVMLSAADAAAQAARLFDVAGRRGAGAAEAARAAGLARECGGAATPALRDAVRPLPLSAREREIASLVAEGLSNRDIAQRLTVSVRTVEGHIYRACIKVDAPDRDVLAALVRSRR
ncbi:LuxR C-terminal-related transcriptional regulator [Tsukamurella sp. 8F]|uniref:helix-turn-helix transcriptional regulator n=1 Tax=unclassified Tsukamurella TaxID=2633480 RepID=UPI0023B8B260|nr:MULTISPECIES: LuxR family transcriptional regulator [unclassified Tsukamurella]MDF0528800.1 LuxR C-terminal-related transcriptional regulator [Tsukamurella sp. 8J]MDF0586635.1 LuxR C-terminal-related transcriptional regulator [Tsukamurella sp. 8F]